MKYIIPFITILFCILKHGIEATSIPVNYFRENDLDWNENEAISNSKFRSEELYQEQDEEEAKQNEVTQMGKSIAEQDSFPQYADENFEDLEEKLKNYEYVEDEDIMEELSGVKRKLPVYNRRKYEFTARVFNVNFSTSLDKAMENNGKQIEMSSKITIPNQSSATLEYRTSVKQSREQFFETTLTNTYTRFRRVYFEFSPAPFLSHTEGYEEPKLQKDRKVHTVNVKEYEIEATVIVPAHSCVEISFLLDWIENFQTKFNAIMEINGVVFTSSRKGHMTQVPLSPETIENILNRKGISFIKPRSDEYIPNGKSLYVRVSGDLRATFGSTAYMSSVDIPCHKKDEKDKGKEKEEQEKEEKKDEKILKDAL